MKWNREDFLDLMTFQRVPRQMLCELMGPLIGLDKEWKEQGATAGELELTEFCFDYVPVITVGNIQAIHELPDKILEDSEEYTISTDYLGRTVKLCKASATIPLPLDFPVKTMADWLKIRHMYEFDPCRIDWDQIERAKELQKKGTLIRAAIPGGFDMPRELMGEVNCCLAYYEQPELMTDMMDTIRETAVKVLEAVGSRITLDYLAVHEDMAGKGGPLIGPNQVRQFIKPYYHAAWEAAKKAGARVFGQDSDGNIGPVIESFLESGVNLFYPCEPAAGMDIVKLREQYGTRAAFMGGIDKHVLRRTKEEIRAELEYKLQPKMQRGVCFGLDHRIPNGTPLENYRYYVKTARELLGITDQENGWGRMAL